MDDSSLNTVKDLTSIVAPFTSAIVETWLKPKLQKLFKDRAVDGKIFEDALYNKFTDYLAHAYQKYFYLNVLVLPNQQIRLDDLYLPLRVKSGRTDPPILMDDYKEDFIPKYEKVLITDRAGVGKSTLLKFLFLSAIKKNKGIPVFVELRSLTSEYTLLKYILNELTLIDEEADKEFILRLIRNGDFIFFLDGYDEITFDQRKKVAEDLHDFITKASSNNFIITSRPELSLTAFPQFQLFHIQPLIKAEAYALLRKYDNSGSVSEQLISKLETKEYTNLEEFLSNPLLVSLLYKSYEYKPTIPFKKHIFYRQVYDALYEAHDLSKGGAFVREKLSKLDIEDFHRVLRCLGFLTLKLGKIEYDKDRLLLLIGEAKSYLPGLDFKEGQFLEDLIKAVPFFIHDGDSYRWAHKSIQEYFAAQFIFIDSKDQQIAILNAISHSRNVTKYTNVLDLYYDIDYKTFRRTIILDLLNDFINFYDTSYLRIALNGIRKEDIHKRRISSYGFEHIIFPQRFFLAGESIGGSLIRHVSHKLLSESREGSDNSSDSERGYVTSVDLISNKIILFIVPDSRRTILQILHAKNESFITLESDIPHILNIRTKNLDFDNPFVLDDNPDSESNQPMFFESVTELLLASSLKEILDIEKCRTLKTEIEVEIKRESKTGFLLSGF
jgi:hypothetical protein